jgi:folate-dependent phosphoribosylglycinamide formyltransferase PurN
MPTVLIGLIHFIESAGWFKVFPTAFKEFHQNQFLNWHPARIPCSGRCGGTGEQGDTKTGKKMNS